MAISPRGRLLYGHTYSKSMDQPGKVAKLARAQLNRKMNISLSAFAPENLVSRDGFGSPVPRQPAHLHTQAESGVYETSIGKVDFGTFRYVSVRQSCFKKGLGGVATLSPMIEPRQPDVPFIRLDSVRELRERITGINAYVGCQRLLRTVHL